MEAERWAFNHVSPDGREATVMVYETRKEAEAARKGFHRRALVSRAIPFRKGTTRWVLQTELHGNQIAELPFDTRKEAMRWRKLLDARTKWVGMPEKREVIR